MGRATKRKKEFEKFGEKPYTLADAANTISGFPKTNFDETVELHFHLNVNVKTSDQSVRGTVILPHGTGKIVKIAVFCKGAHADQAKDAGADFVGANDLIEKVAKGFLDFDVVVSTPEMMRDISKLGKVLGPRGLMPSPKAGTVTTDIERVVKELKGGRVEFKADKQGGVHVGIGKRSFKSEQIVDNANRLIEALNAAKPASVKGALVKTAALSTTMGPGLKVSV